MSGTQLPPEHPEPVPYRRPTTAGGTVLGGVTVISPSTVRVVLGLEVTEPLGVDWLAVSVAVTLRLPSVPAGPPTEAAEQLVLFELGAQPNPVGKLFGVKV